MKEQAIIVGGTTGMGKATAELLLKNGVEVIVLGRPNKNLDSTKNELSKLGAIKTVGIDLFDEDALQNFINELKIIAPKVKYLVNAAGYFSPKSFLEHSADDYDTYHNFNKAFFFITQAVAKLMKKNGTGSIVNIGSMWAKQAIKATPSSAYSMAK
ncbi:MAG: SDR family oxidoreductase, partial [Bacteroidota bacterium]